MPKIISKSDALIEVQDALARHLDLLRETRQRCITDNTGKFGFHYLAAIPIIYAAWEGYFRLVCAVCIKRQCDSLTLARSYPAKYATLWFQTQPFVSSFLDRLTASTQLGKTQKVVGKQFECLSDFSEKVAHWHDQVVDQGVDFQELVMTHANVNKDVLKLNAAAIGLSVSGVKVGRLDELLGFRNNIAHGGLLTFPTEEYAEELVDYCEELIKSFDSVVTTWLNST